MYAAFGQSFVSPVAYLPSHLWQEGYKVVAEISRGREGLQVPFYTRGFWKLRREVIVQEDSTLLYIEGIVGNLTIIQDGRILLRGRGPWLSVGLIGKGRMILDIEGDGGGILGGIYLLARRGMQAWGVERYPLSPPLCSSGVGYFRAVDGAALLAIAQTQNLCWQADFMPPAHIQVLLHHRKHSLRVDSSSREDISPFPIHLASLSADGHFRAVQKVGFVVLWVLLSAFVSMLPALREVFWRGVFEHTPVGLVEIVPGVGWVVGALSLILLPHAYQLWALIMVFMIVETIILHGRRASGWAWQSWLLPAAILLSISLIAPSYEMYALGSLWLVRAVGIARLFPDFAYLWSTEVFFIILIMPT